MKIIFLLYIVIFLLIIFVIVYSITNHKEKNINLLLNKRNKKNWSRISPRLKRKYRGRLPGVVFPNKLNMDSTYDF